MITCVRYLMSGSRACVSSVWRMVNITHFAARGNDVNFLTQAALWR